MQGEFVKGYDEWMTDPKWLQLARDWMGDIQFDPASNPVAQQYVNATFFAVSPDVYPKIYAKYDNVINDGLDSIWCGNVWCNPPYSAGNIDAFVDKALAEWSVSPNNSQYPIHNMLYLVNSSTDTQWYHKLMNACDAALIVRGRIKFWKIVNGVAYEKWEGQKSIEARAKDPTLKPKIGNAPRYLNTLFMFTRDTYMVDRFYRIFGDKGTVILPYCGYAS